MARPKVAVSGFVVAGILFLVASVIPVLRGDELNVTLVILAIAFFLIALAIHGKSTKGDTPPAAKG